MAEENLSQEFRLKDIDETRKYLIEEINQNDLMSKKHKKVCMALNYMEQSLILVSAITGCVSVSANVSLICIFISIASFAVGLKICAIPKGIKKSILKKHKKA